jgi:hypothetical protein
MERPNTKVVMARQNRWIRLAGRIAIIATLSLWTFGALHAAEHSARHDSPLCATCLAVTDEGLAHTARPLLHASFSAEDAPIRVLETKPDGAREFRLTARAPPLSLI